MLGLTQLGDDHGLHLGEVTILYRVNRSVKNESVAAEGLEPRFPIC